MIAIAIFVLVILLGLLFIALTPQDRKVLLSRKQNFNFNDNQRSYLLYKPSEVSPKTKLIVGLHGFGGNARQFAYYTALHNVASDAIIVYPNATDPIEEGIKHGWNAKICCGSGWKSGADDAGFIVALTDSLASEHDIAKDNVYVAGFSNGAFMALRLATDYPEYFKAVAVGSGSIGTTKARLEPQSAVPIFLMHGEKDTIVPFNGGVGSSDPDFNWLSFADTKQTWAQVNNQKAEVKVQTYREDGHVWHGWRLFKFWTQKPAASRDVVGFFNMH